MKKFVLILIPLVLTLLLLRRLAESTPLEPGPESGAHADDRKEEESFPSFNSGVVAQGAFLTWRNYVERWNKTRGTPLSGDTELGTQLWADGIARLKPEYVYTHGVNIVIVRSRHGEDEEGFYVALSIASAPGPNDEQFTRMLIAQHAGGTVFTFRRCGHYERTQAEKLK